MTAQPTEPLPRRELEPIDPDSEAGRAISAGLGELFDDVIERFRREGKPLPHCLREEPATATAPIARLAL